MKTIDHSRLMFMVESDNGFGHFNVIKELSRTIKTKSASIAVASGTFYHSNGIFDFCEFEKFALPGIVWDENGSEYVSLDSGINYEYDHHTTSLRAKSIASACETFRPTAIVFELYPFMMPYRDIDIEAVKDFYSDKSERPAIICLCRDIIHSEDPSWTIETLNSEFDHVIVRGDGIQNRLSDCMEEFEDIQTPLEYLGNIASPMPSSSVAGDQDRPVVVFAGGGHRSHDADFFKVAIEARQHSHWLRNRPWHVFISNNCDENEFKEYLTFAEHHGGSVVISRPIESDQFKQLMVNSCAAIIRGGYNTTHELVQSRIPFIMVPRESLGINDEQRMRALLLEKAGRAVYFEEARLFNQNASLQLAQTLDAMVDSHNPRDAAPVFDGSERIAARLCEIGRSKYHVHHSADGAWPQGMRASSSSSFRMERDSLIWRLPTQTDERANV